MELRQLRYFVTVAQVLNFSEAAKRLYVTQPGLSKQISELEKELGLQLFIRNKRYVGLTSAGAALLKEASDLLARSEKFAQKTRQVASGAVGSLKIGFMGLSEQSFLPQLLRRFGQVYPDIDLTLTMYKSWHLMTDALNDQDLDLGFTLSLGLDSSKELMWETLFSSVLTLAVPYDHPLAGEETIDNLSVLAREPFIHVSRETYSFTCDHLMELCSHHGFSPNIVRRPQDNATWVLLVEAGMGVAILSHHVINASHRVRLIDLSEEFLRLDLVIAWNKQNLNPSLPLFLDEIKVSRPELQKACNRLQRDPTKPEIWGDYPKITETAGLF